MWSPTISSSTALPIDNKENTKEIVDDSRCDGDIRQFDQKQQKKLKFDDQINQQHSQDIQAENLKFKLPTEETIDSGIISELENSTSEILNIDKETIFTASDTIKKPHTRSYPELQYKAENQPNLDSGILHEEFIDSECDLEEKKKLLNETATILPYSVDSGISEQFSNLSLQNNSNSVNSSSPAVSTHSNNFDVNNEEPKMAAQQTRTTSSADDNLNQEYPRVEIPQQITLVNAWEKFYQQNDDGDTPLHLACISGYEEVVIALIRMAPHPCLFNIQNDDVQTPLHLATLTAQPKIIRLLLIAGAKPSIRDRRGNTALHLACMSGEEECVRALTNPISASEVNEAQRQCSHRANDKSYLKYAELPSDLEIRNYDGERCVHLAAKAGLINILRILVLHGADINAREGKSGHTPLHIAIETCNEELMNYLVYGCQKLDLETVTYGGLTAYQVACILNKSEMRHILEKRGAVRLMAPDSDYDSDSDDDGESKSCDRFGDRGYFAGYKGGNSLKVA